MHRRRKHSSDDDNDDDDDENNENSDTTPNDSKRNVDKHRKKKKKQSKKPKENHTEKWGTEKTKEKETDEYQVSPDVGLAWTEEEMRTLVDKMESQLPKEDTVPYSRRVAKMDWEKVKFDPYTAEDCKKKFQEILRKQRTHRLCSEILQDIREWVKKPWKNNSSKPVKRHPDMPPHPLSSYMLFFQDKKPRIQKKHPNLSVTEQAKLLGEMFNALPEDKKEMYRLKAVEKREEYKIKLQEFYDKHPDFVVEKKKQRPPKVVEQVGPVKPLSPFKLYCESKINKHKDDPGFDSKKIVLRCKEQWKKMSDRKKAVWIKWTLDREQQYMAELTKYIAEHPDVDTSKLKQNILNKEEREILDRLAGKPKKPPSNAYSYFCSTNMTNDSFHNGQIKLKDLAERWKALPEIEKLGLADKVKKLQEKYKEDFEAYLETLPEDKRIEELQKIAKVNQKKKPKAKETHQPVISRWIEKKKKEMSGSNLYKNEPPQPPGSAFDYFVKKFSEKYPNISEDKLMAKTKSKWQAFTPEKKNKYREELQILKNRFIKDYEAFLKNLNERELAEYSVLKNRQTKPDGSEESDSSSSSSSSSDSDDDEADDKNKKAEKESNSSDDDSD